jgi:Tfp pilus assembly protein PilE
MIRLVGTVILTLAVASLLSCQSYSTGLQQSVARADEMSAVGALKTIATAQQAYALSNSGSYGAFQQLCEAGYLDERFNSATPEIKDYVLSMDVTADSYRLNADPARAGEQAGRHLYMDSTSPLIRVNATQPATAKDPLMQP